MGLQHDPDWQSHNRRLNVIERNMEERFKNVQVSLTIIHETITQLKEELLNATGHQNRDQKG